jgi:hypothetical protein
MRKRKYFFYLKKEKEGTFFKETLGKEIEEKGTEHGLLGGEKHEIFNLLSKSQLVGW